MRAARNLVEIIKENEKEQKEDAKENTFFKDTYNNIIAFTGERGTGKSSSMISFAFALKDLRSNGKEIVFNKKIDNLIRECHFEEIRVIDPSMLEEKDNILEIVIANMFSRFNQRIEGIGSNMDYNEKRELLKAFQKVYENLRVIQKEKHERLDGEIIETLSSLASGSNLKESIIINTTLIPGLNKKVWKKRNSRWRKVMSVPSA
jgi:ABC-type lipoprotein export system ATPase subunit